jgi:hypothetical protein
MPAAAVFADMAPRGIRFTGEVSNGLQYSS